jgi:Stage II sporulation protein E (SpoIIE)
MARRFTAFVFLVLLAHSGAATAQSALIKPSEFGHGDASTPVILGQSMVPLYGPWKFHIGDSPIQPGTNQPLWATPDFDDSSWETVDLNPKSAVNHYHGLSGWVTGWGDRGHPNYWGYGWYRIRVKIHAQPGEPLALAGPANFDDAYQVFLNGALLGSFGRFDRKRPRFYYTEPMVFPLPQASASTAAGGDSAPAQAFAFRLWMSPTSLLDTSGAGGMHLAPLIGTTNAVAAEYQLRWLDVVRENAVWALTGIVDSLLAVLAFSLFLLNRKDRVYLWMGALFLMMGLGGAETALAAWTQTVTVPEELWICYVFVVPAVTISWVMLLRAWFGLDRPRWLPWAAVLLSLAQAFAYAGVLDLLFPLIPSSAAPSFYVLSQVLRAMFLLLMGWLVFRGIRKLGLEGWLVLPAAVLTWGDWLAAQFTFLHVPRRFFPFGVSLTLEQITGILIVLALCVLLVRRWLHSAQLQRQMTQEMKQAQEVQQVLIPEAVPQIPGFTIESIYHPAGEVGGDFFQILPAKQGGVLLCIGDVSGKGMPAAMTVSLLIGTLRTLANYSQSPAEILAAMNQRILGRSRGGFTTCLILLAAPDGTVTVANAGHLPPYLDGQEISLENGLPLGLVAESTYSESTFHQHENEQITLVTDGIVEARAASGELFGFDRTAAIAAQSAAQISSTARDFGQDDDITVLTVTRWPVGKQSSSTQNATILSPSIT